MSRTTRAGARPPQGPTPEEAQRQAAEAGRFEELLEVLAARPWTMIDVEATWAQVARAVAVRSRRDPERFAADLFAEMVKFSGLLLMRPQFVLGLRIAQHGRMMRTRGHADFAPDVLETHIPRLVELQGHVAELLQGQAATARAWQLARRGRIKNDRAERPAPPRAPKPGRDGKGVNGKAVKAHAGGETRSPAHADGETMNTAQANGKTRQEYADGKPVNRVGGLFDGPGVGGGGENSDDD